MLKRLHPLYTIFALASLLLLSACSSMQKILPGPSGLSSPPQKIALLLPMQGNLAGAGNAVRNGLFSAYYADNNTGKASRVNVYDTTQGNIVSVYQKAVQQGADVIVGPLTKADVDALGKNGGLKVPTLALNTLDNQGSAPRNLYQFALSPTDEAVQAAQKAYADGHRHILLITPTGAWGQSIKQAFASTFQSEGGAVVGTLDYSPQTNLTKGVAQLLNYSQLKKPDPKHPGRTIPVPQLRNDFDSIFLVATPTTGRLVKPLLLFYYAGSTPVYSISSIYSGRISGGDRDLDGIKFCDMPWVLENTPAIDAAKANAAKLWPASFYQYTKLYAMGIDAYSIVNHFNSLSSAPGMTGALSMDSNGVIHRQLDWAVFQGGAPQLTSTAH